MLRLVLALCLSARAQVPPAPGRPVDALEITGAFPDADYPTGRAAIAKVWELVKEIGEAPAGLAPPRLHFAAFDPAKQDPDWTAWQGAWAKAHPSIFLEWVCNYSGRAKYPEAEPLCGQPESLKAWAARHPELLREYPFPQTFRAFHYDGTDRIQVNPYTTYVGTLLQGIPLKDLRLGYYVTGHELMHYVYESRGIAGPTHHCLFVTGSPSPMERLADALIESGLSHPMIKKFGLDAEKGLAPCAKP